MEKMTKVRWLCTTLLIVQGAGRGRIVVNSFLITSGKFGSHRQLLIDNRISNCIGIPPFACLMLPLERRRQFRGGVSQLGMILDTGSIFDEDEDEDQADTRSTNNSKSDWEVEKRNSPPPEQYPPARTFYTDSTSSEFLSENLGSAQKQDGITEEKFKEREVIDDEFEEHIPKFNTVTLSGRIGSTPEPRYFDDGKVVVNVGLAVKRKYHPLERKAFDIAYGEEETDWFTLEIWGRDAEFMARFITKGARVGVVGSLSIDSWIDKVTGEERSKPKILVREFDILESKAEAELRQRNQRQRDTFKSSEGGNYDGGGGASGRGGGPRYSSSTGSQDFFT